MVTILKCGINEGDFMRNWLLAAVIIPRIYLMDVDVKDRIGVNEYDVVETVSSDLITTTTEDRPIIFIAELCDARN